ncbi:bifunctional nuclease family protein [Thermodesulfobacterium sp. TA1]|uniref:bifunctional nuclease family protein n=1 Tax=Thermodesulfobacterium sp. TA1 TaxID=2234087 RepID=UPI001231867C|nr:bifunctional nuclease family protein [Thermodesulfobacterium sp. TA1]QER41616.1 bifunctional nuclease family protein [Thermodesulfobacterium sp. TA1]
MKIRMVLHGIAMDPMSNSPVMLLKEVEGDRILPIWIGVLEATSIAAKLENIQFPRPLTHDLMKNIFESLGITIPKVEIVDLRDNTYYAVITVATGDKTLEIDSRPSDAIALALRLNAEIFVEEEVLKKSQLYSDTPVAEKQGEMVVTTEEEKEKLKEMLETLDPKLFKYKM